MSKSAVRACLLIFSLGWGLFVIADWLPAQLGGDCMTHSEECHLASQYERSIVLWRGLSVELIAVVIYLFLSRRRIV